LERKLAHPLAPPHQLALGEGETAGSIEQ
jgi:hypothetical protein